MDSLTQLVFGAACGEAILGKKVGRKALIWGGVLGTLPDLDVFIPLGSPVDDFVSHRGFSHSLFLLAILSPLIARLITTIHQDSKHLYIKWVLFSFVVLEGSVLLDLLTIYGTQIFWPFDTTPHAVPSLFIIDPLFTLPILIGVLAALFLKNHRLNTVGLSLSLAYLIMALGTGIFVKQKMEVKLTEQGVSYSKFVCSPAPFTTLLWRTVGIHQDQYFETYYSLFDGDIPLSIDFYPRNLDLMNGIEEHAPVVKLKNFTKGYFSMSDINGSIAMTDLRMGSEPNYVFQFKVAEIKEIKNSPIKAVRLKAILDWSQLPWLWERVWKHTAQL
ncbi:MAG: metal-dependent hydrolase [Opitutales bacterium]|nr:metal-dependent hydrolase [Opitutales bacterium]